LVVLDGEPFNYPYSERDPNNATEKIWKEFEVKELPWIARSQTVGQGALIDKLKGIHEDGRIYLGVMSRKPYAKAERSGATMESVQRAYDEWIKRNKVGTQPEHTWILDDRPSVLTPDRRAIASKWWTEYRATLAK
jgi:hypothetical protein